MIHSAIRILTISACMAGICLLIPRIYAIRSTRSLIFTAEDVPSRRIAIVFGAGLEWDGTPSPVLRDRVTTAADLYFSGKVEKLLMSGDNRFIDYNEPGSMREYAISLGVPEEDIVLDYAGRRTYDTCYRALEIFQVQEAILVTQSFHLPRALITCNKLGLPAIGVASDLRNYSGNLLWTLREFPATAMAFWETWVSKPLPVLGNPEPIFTEESGISTASLPNRD